MSRTKKRNRLVEKKEPRGMRLRLNFYMLAFIVYWYAPIEYGHYLSSEFKMGAFATDSDAIAIPLMAFLFLWSVGFPVFIVSTIGLEMFIRWSEQLKTVDQRSSAVFGNKSARSASNKNGLPDADNHKSSSCRMRHCLGSSIVVF